MKFINFFTLYMVFISVHADENVIVAMQSPAHNFVHKQRWQKIRGFNPLRWQVNYVIWSCNVDIWLIPSLLLVNVICEWPHILIVMDESFSENLVHRNHQYVKIDPEKIPVIRFVLPSLSRIVLGRSWKVLWFQDSWFSMVYLFFIFYWPRKFDSCEFYNGGWLLLVLHIFLLTHSIQKIYRTSNSLINSAKFVE